MALRDGQVFALTLKSKTKLSDIYDEELNLSPAIQKLHVSILYHHIIRQVWIGNPEVELEEEDILYMDDPAAALKCITDRKAAAAFILNPCSPQLLIQVLSTAEMIPPFTVRIHPPLITGPIIRDMSVRH